ncbi:uncharacterized protein (TIGR02145 family) [Fibrobacter sp. UWS1]|nr:uncharacterized protein (TIGR02145 family) [Fibrobacter sp. UWS1]
MGIARYVFQNCIKQPLLFMLVVSCACVYAGSFTGSRDGERYPTIKIGKSEWMAENLRYNVRGSICFRNEPRACFVGRYYNFDMAEHACPSGWHLPSRQEWTEIFDVADSKFVTDLTGYCYDDGTCFDSEFNKYGEESSYFWPSSDDNGTWTSRRSDSFIKSMFPRRHNAYAVKYSKSQRLKDYFVILVNQRMLIILVSVV